MVESDVAAEDLTKPVGDRFGVDLTPATGRERKVFGLLAAAKVRYGYP